MQNGKEKSILLILLCAALLIGLTACKPEPSVGNVTDNTDLDAPKEIGSREIAEFYTCFYRHDCETEEGGHSFEFGITTDESGVLTASEKLSGLSFPVDEALLCELQEIIEGQDLVSKNGVYKLTAGLAPECGRCELTVTYATGEVLTFTVNNDPFAPWSRQVYTAFQERFCAQGETFFLPPYPIE